jgi:hypothetical protein
MGRDKSVLRVSAMTGILDVGWKGILLGVLLQGWFDLLRADSKKSRTAGHHFPSCLPRAVHTSNYLLFAVAHHASDV